MGRVAGSYGVRGWIKAINADTGEQVWQTYTIPGPGEPGNDTWAGESWKYGGGSAWITGSYDKDTNRLYWPVGNPGPDFDRHVRLGDNLFTNSNLVMDPDTGKILSYFNYTPNDPYDYDGVNEMILADIGGKKLWFHGSRNGHVYGIDRETTAKSKAGNEHKCVWVTALQRVNWTKPLNTGNNCKPVYNYPEKDVVYDKVTTISLRPWMAVKNGIRCLIAIAPRWCTCPCTISRWISRPRKWNGSVASGTWVPRSSTSTQARAISRPSTARPASWYGTSRRAIRRPAVS